jgi:hypothetical protein
MIVFLRTVNVFSSVIVKDILLLNLLLRLCKLEICSVLSMNYKIIFVTDKDVIL